MQTQERILLFERLGGVDLSKLEPEITHDVLVEARSGLFHHRKAMFSFTCPECGKHVTNDQLLEPLCTGPNWTDNHPPTIMQLMTPLFV